MLLDTKAGRRVARIIVKRFRASLHYSDNIPREGGALLVGNHGYWGIDALPLALLLTLQTGRTPRFLGERSLWKVPGTKGLWDALGIVRGEPELAVRLLEEDELVCVYPGGVDDAFKLSSEAYTLKWKERAGFARVAMRAKAPIVPIAAVGIDELFEVRRREHVLGRRLLGSDRYDLPVPKSVFPRKVALDYYALSIIYPSGDPTIPADVERIRRATIEALEAVLKEHRREREP